MTEALCRLCGYPISQHGDDPDECPRRAIRRIEELERRAGYVIQIVGEPGKCRGCGAEIFWLKAFKSGKAVPYDATGVSHFATCPNAVQFRKQGA